MICSQALWPLIAGPALDTTLLVMGAAATMCHPASFKSRWLDPPLLIFSSFVNV